jgi:shikimate dehydrogenase
MSRRDIAEVQKHITNTLDPSVIAEKKIAGVVGEAPSEYSKSPALWNAAFDLVTMDAIYLPLDVDESCLGELMSALRDSEQVMGINVTVPYKVKILEYLDELDPSANRIRAVNTVVRTPAGRLIGYNTDGEGFVDSILSPQPGQQESFTKSLKGMDVLLLGAGGSARAVAFHVADLLGHGRLIICNRTIEHAQSLAKDIRKTQHQPKAVAEDELPRWAPKVGLIINSTTKGQSSLRKLPDGQIINLEPYSALAPAHPPAFREPEFKQRWWEAARPDIEANNDASMRLAASIPESVGFYDLIYHPEETVFLRHGKETGHRTLNGKRMIISQAVIAFCEHICKTELQSRGIDKPETFRRVSEIMNSAW